ncbi:sensor domain-containing diguanylate cyclase [Kangiella koreensis]|uniref:diguanylate cyclase n=1 Tax=Kangiella koreensis (strain DSM 16069 / JCM 12317 / KCTC 12182 / SW-125) TaxID=523791 RepID=C7R8C4_KANKD|nr:diguanylate cyclase [Kangiella koreensis]ACV27689.1 diguanylate cyclase [Kangiella koreensis DSM 16069]
MNQYISGLVYGALALIANLYFVLPVYGNLSLHLGEFFVIFCLVTRGLSPALMASILGSLGLYITTGNPWFFAVSILEILVLHYLLKKEIVLLVADLLFWLLIGLPITYLVIVFIYEVSTQDFAHVVLLKQALNGILIVSIVSLVRPFAPASWYSKNYTRTTLKLSSRIFEVSLISIALPSLIVALILSDSSADNAEKQISQLLKIKAENHVDSIESHVQHHRDAIDSLALLLVEFQLDETKTRELLEKWNSTYEGFLTMLIADASGSIIHGSPKTAFDKITQLPASERIVTDRSYFYVAKKTEQNFISTAFKGRGFGHAPIVAISSPLLRNGDFKGIVQGSLDLPQFDGSDNKEGRVSYLIVTDSNNSIVYASDGLGLENLSRFEPVDETITFTNTLPVLTLSTGNYLYHFEDSKQGWNIYALADASQLIGFYKQNFYRLMVALFLISILGLVFTRRLSKQITDPLVGIVKSFAAHKVIVQEPNSIYTSKEVESVRYQLREAQQLTLEYQENLKEEVAAKTSELIAMNERLEKMSVEDELTKIYNRRGFEAAANEAFKLACRNRTALTFAMLDIDHFKRVNDTWGHVVGDECIVMVAKELKKVFLRETDFYARYGGEEFVVLLTGGNTDKHCRMLEQLRKDIENHKVAVDGENISLTVSIGVFSLKEDFNISYHQLVSKADKLLYQSKTEGRNRISSDCQ